MCKGDVHNMDICHGSLLPHVSAAFVMPYEHRIQVDHASCMFITVSLVASTFEEKLAWI